MSTAIIIGIVVLLGGVVGVFLYLRAQKQKAEAERQRNEAKRAQAEMELKAERKEREAKAEAKMERKIKAMKAESDAKLARLEATARRREQGREKDHRERQERERRQQRKEKRSARKAEKRRMERPRRRGTKEEGRDFRQMLGMISTILFKPPPGLSPGGGGFDSNIRKTKQILATIRAGTADKETVKRWKSAWKLAKVKIRQRKEKRRARKAARLAEIRAKKAAKRAQGGRWVRGRWRPWKPSFRRPNPRPKWTRDAQGRKRLPDGRVWMGSSLGWRTPTARDVVRPRPVRGRPERGGHPFCRQSNPYARKNCIREYNRNRKTCRKVGGCGWFRKKKFGAFRGKLKLRPKRKLRPKKKAEIY